MWTLAVLAYFLLLLTESSSIFLKCCPNGYAFGNDLRCVISVNDDDTIIYTEIASGNKTESIQSCFRSGEGVSDFYYNDTEFEENVTKVEKCVDVDNRNGTIYTKTCPTDWRDRIGQCDSLFKPLFFWGTSIVLFANLFYIFPYLIVVIFFIAVPELRNRAYDQAVLSYNASQVMIALILLGMGYFILCHKPIKPVWIYIVLGLTLQFLTTTSVFFLNVICFDMTLVITRFRWIPGSDVTGSEECRKSKMYAAYAWGGGAIITAITAFVELSHWIPTTSLLKPNFKRFDDGPNYTLFIYVFVVPVMTLILNNILFIYTTYKVIKIRKSTAIANENNRNVRKKYFVFLRLYLVMDAPWILGVMAAAYSDLWVLKFCRMLQPILMLLAILPKKKFYRAMKCSNTPVANIDARKKNNRVETRC